MEGVQAGWGGGLFLLFCPWQWRQGEGLKWLRTGSENRICVPSPTTNTCDPSLGGKPAVFMVQSSWEKPLTIPSFHTVSFLASNFYTLRERNKRVEFTIKRCKMWDVWFPAVQYSTQVFEMLKLNNTI